MKSKNIQLSKRHSNKYSNKLNMSNTTQLKKYLLYLVLFCLFVGSSKQAFGENIYSGWVYSGEKITVDNSTYVVQFSGNLEEVILQKENVLIVAPYHSCGIENNVKLCFNITGFDSTTKTNKAKITVEKLIPSITLKRAIQKNTLFQGEKTNVSVEFKNTGEESAEEATFIDDFSGFNITDVYGECKKEGNKIVWSGRLKRGESKTCKYYVLANEILEKTTKASFEYFDGEKKTAYSPAISIKVTPLFDMKLFFQDSEISVGNLTRIVVNITAKNNESVLDYFRVYLPLGITFNKSASLNSNARLNSLTKQNEYYVWNGTVANTTSIVFYVEGKYVGFNELLFDEGYSYFGKKYTYSLKKTLNVKKDEVLLTTSLVDGEQIEGGSTKWIKIFVENKNKFSKIKNLNLVIDSPLFNGSTEQINYYFDELNSSQKTMIFYIKKVFPSVDLAKSYQFNINMTYNTNFGETFSSNLKSTLSLQIPSALTITNEVSDSSPHAEDKITITTKVKNDRKKEITGIFVSDNAQTVIGSNTATINLNSSETKTAYTYQLKVPYVSNDSSFNLTTKATYSENGILRSYTQSKVITILKKNLKLDVSKTTPEIVSGTFFSNAYELSNSNSEPIYNINLRLSKQENFDLVDSFYSIEKLSPGEKIKFYLEQKAKLNGSINYVGETISFYDNHNTRYEQNLSSAQVTVLSSVTNSPKIYILKNVSIAKKNNPTKITLNLKNKGEGSNILLFDDENEWILFLAKNSETNITYESTFYENKTISLPPAKVTYNYLGKNISSYSNNPVVVVLPENTLVGNWSRSQTINNASLAQVEPKEIKTEEITVNLDPVAVNGSQVKSPVEKTEGFFQKFFSLFDFLSGKN